MRVVRSIVVLVALAAMVMPAAAHAAPEWRSMTGGVGWDPCVAPVVLRPNDAGSYSGSWRNDLSSAAATINEAVGRTLLRIGSGTTETAKTASPPVYFTDLPGATAGTAYISWSVDGSGTPRHITRGSVALDAGQLAAMPPTTRMGVMVHELGHLLGLAHVGDAHEALSNGFLYEGGVGAGTGTALSSLYAVACGTHPRIADGPYDWALPTYTGHVSSVRTWNVGTSAQDVVQLGVALTGASLGERGPGWADHAVVCRDDVFADCLVGAALAGSDGPVLFVPGGVSATTVPATVLSAIGQSLRPGGTVYVLGGPAAVSDRIHGALAALWPTERLYGDDRTETAVAVATEVVANNGRRGVALIARDDNPADAVTAGAAAGHRGLPILLSNRGALSGATATALGSLGVSRTLMLGGEAALAPQVQEALQRQGRNPRRVQGVNRAETSVAVARDGDLWGRTRLGSTATFVGLNGYHDQTWALALAAAPLAAHRQAPVLLTRDSDVPADAGVHGEPGWYLARLDAPGAVEVTYIYVGVGRWSTSHAANSFRSYLFVGR